MRMAGRAGRRLSLPDRAAHNRVRPAAQFTYQRTSPALPVTQDYPANDPYYLGGTDYVSSLGYPALCRVGASAPLKITYPIGSSYRYLTAELGLTDVGPQKGQDEQATFEVDEDMNDGTSKDLGKRSSGVLTALTE
jgi:hypothetical protein